MRPIGYYVHHQGAGHWERAAAIGRSLRRPCVFFGTFPEGAPRDPPGEVVVLPDDRLGEDFGGDDGEASRPLGLHYAPLGHAGVRARMSAIAAWVDSADPVLMIVDVSVEMALLARLLSVPTIVFRLAGDRWDPPHLEAFRSAHRLVAPFPGALDTVDVPDWVWAKTIHAGFLADAAPRPRVAGGDGTVVVVLGRGGETRSARDLAAMAMAAPDRRWEVLGPVAGAETVDLPANLHLHGWVDDVPARIAGAEIVVGSGGDGTIAAVVAAGRRFVCLPEPRAYGEQIVKARALSRLGAAVVHEGWPHPGAWSGLLADATRLDLGAITSLVQPDAVARLADTIEEIALALENGRSGFS